MCYHVLQITRPIKLAKKREIKVTILFCFCFTVNMDADTCGVKFVFIKLIEIFKIKGNTGLF